ncbi:HET-6OR heterokaryon incompatibility protein (het-6OR allele) [Podospora australis]|uniref:HET-6OR heterokaryon incompatibility protein (Het-6OR allele) n=1 Tax=Podospora australis TaxID=1536484 RepID=A0AAN6WPA9_9PEZI|nr:HET-6OR heterokaryon incompatibility protein (het-6OR allele) [Podospora australis]
MTNRLPNITLLSISLQAFTYHTTKLDQTKTEFRLLELFPACESPDGVLTCRVFVTTVENPSRPYQALSYVWGSDTKDHFIHVYPPLNSGDNDYKSTKLPITRSLFIALNHLRHLTENVTLWIDQICINQTDNGEKAHQVQLMGRIYSSASQVLVWLGPSSGERCDELMDRWATIGRWCEELDLLSYYNRERWLLMQSYIHNEDPDDPNTKAFQGLFKRSAEAVGEFIWDGTMKAFFAREWFTRAWITQEFCLCADTVFACGAKRFAVELLMQALQAAQHGGAMLNDFSGKEGADERNKMVMDVLYGEPTAKLFACRVQRQKFVRKVKHSMGHTLFQLLKTLHVEHTMNATEHRDRIYSLLGLAVDAEHLGIKADYTKGTEATAKVLTQAAKAMITNPHSGRVEVLSFAQWPKSFGDEEIIPSWVPDWRPQLRPSIYEIRENVDQHFFCACGEEALKVRPIESNDQRVLGLKGWVVDEIEEAGDETWGRSTWVPEVLHARFANIERLHEKAMANPFFPGYGEAKRKEALWRVPIGDMFWDRTKVMPLRARFACEDDAVLAEKIQREHKDLWDAMEVTVAVQKFEAGLPETEKEWVEAMERHKAFGWEERRANGGVGAGYRESMNYVVAKKPFLTKKGNMGMGPGELEAGDVVVVFCGGRIPFVLRPGRGGERYQFVGEAYCHGIMDGEVATDVVLRDIFVE